MTIFKSDRRQFLLLIAVTSLFYLFMVLSIPIWVDEAITVQQSSLSIGALLSDSIRRFDAVHLFYYLVCWLIGLAFNDSLYALRLLSVLATIGTMRNIYRFTRTKVDRTTALLSAGLFAFLPVTVDFATQARSTALVTYLISYAIQTAIKFEGRLDNFRLLSILIAASLFLTINVTAIVGYVVFAAYLVFSNRNYFFNRRKCLPIIAPILFSLPTFALALMQKSQAAWISSHIHDSDIIPRLLYWPFLESERTLQGHALAGALVATLIACATGFKYFKESLNSFQFFALALAILPPISLLIFSIVQPLFITRYFAYSSIGVSIICGLSLSAINRPLLRTIILCAIAIVCSVNVASFSHERDGQMDWNLITAEIKSGPSDASVVLEPAWSNPLAAYYFDDLPKRDVIEGISDLKISALSGCSDLPNYLWLVTTFARTEEEQVEDLTELGYRKKIDKGKNGMILFESRKC